MAEQTPSADASALDALMQLPIGELLGRDHLAQLASIARLEDYPADTSLFAAGDAADDLWMLISGRVCLSIEIPGQESAMVAALSRGDMLGWTALRGWSEAIPRTAAARVTKPARAMRFSGAELRELCDLDHELGFYIMRHAFEVVMQALADSRMQLLDVYGSR